MERKLKAEVRQGSGKGVARKVRAAGRVPGIVYGHGADPLPITVDAKDLFHILHTDAGANVLVDMRVDGDHFLALPREIQRDHLRGRFVHIDFLRVARDEKITVEVPVQLVGESHGVKEGGVLEHHLWNVTVECFPQDVPPSIEADISGLAITESLKVEDLKVAAKLAILTPPEEVVVAVVPPQVLKLEEEEVEAALEGEAAEPGAATSPVQDEQVDEGSSTAP